MPIRDKLSAIRKALFGDSARAFGTLGLLLLLLLAVVPCRDHFREWYRYQRSYLAADSRPRRRANAAAPFPGRSPADLDSGTRRGGSLRLLPRGNEGEQPRATCATQPFRPHPPIPHSLTSSDA